MGSRLFRLICLDAFPEYGLHIPHGLLNKGGVVQLFRVHHMAVHNAALGQGLPDGDGVYIVQIVLFDLGVEAVLLDELGNPALYLGPGQHRSVGAFRGGSQTGFCRRRRQIHEPAMRRCLFPVRGLSCSGQRRVCSRSYHSSPG